MPGTKPTMLNILGLILLSSWALVSSFQFSIHKIRSSTRTWRNGVQQQQSRNKFFQLYDINEWRDIDFKYPGQKSDDPTISETTDQIVRTICILPFDFREVLLQGETKQLRLYEDRFLQLFTDAVDNHGGIVGMGLLTESVGPGLGLVQTVPLCEITAFQKVPDFGIFVTIQVVARAKLLELTQTDPYIKAACTEVIDEFPPNLELPNLLASNIENVMLLLSSMEHRISKSNSDSEMNRRIQVAKLDDQFYDENNKKDGDDSDSDDDDDDIDSTLATSDDDDRRTRFRLAYQTALDTDTQGYQILDVSGERTPRELTALSWAAFQSEKQILDDPTDIKHVTHRIQALDFDNIFDRLKLAWHVLQEKKTKLSEHMQKAGIKLSDKDNGDGQSESDSNSGGGGI